MTRLQFRVLYRQFLFRMVDLELLSPSAQGDVSKLLGQFAGLLIFLSMVFSFGALNFPPKLMTPPQLLIATWNMENFLIATTMLVVGLFAVLSWDSTFPDRRDVLVLGPLPVRARTLFVAKVAALAAALSLTVAALNLLSGIIWPLHFIPPDGGVLGVARSFTAYWITMLAAGTFIFCSVLGVQGLAAYLLPRRKFLRLSAFLQMAAFCLFLSVYFMQPSLASPKALTAPENQRLLAWLPSYWFLGLFQELNGSAHPALAPLARRAFVGLAAAAFGASTAFLLSYFRALRKIVEEPDIVPASRGLHWSPCFGNSLETAVVLFSLRTLLRSRQHRVMLAFYLGIGFAFLILLVNAPAQRRVLSQTNGALLFSSIVMMCAWVVGTRVVFAMPIALRANWIFRITQTQEASKYWSAIRRPLFVLGVAPVWVVSAAVFLSMWPWRQAVGHLIVLALWGAILAYVGLHGFQKIPFTCSYLPGKSAVHLAFLAGLGLLLLMSTGVGYELRALADPVLYAKSLVILVIAVICARWRTVAGAKSEEAVVQFEEVETPAVQVLGLTRDGVLPMPPAQLQ